MHLSKASLEALSPLGKQDVAVAHLRYMSWKIKSERLVTRWAESAWRYLDGQVVFHRNQKRDNRGCCQSTVTEVLRGLVKMFSVDDNLQYVRAKTAFDNKGFRPTKREEVQRTGCGRLVSTPYTRHQLDKAFATLERAGLLERKHNATGRGKGIQLWLRLRTDRLHAAMDLLSTSKRKDALPDPAKINPLLKNRVSENTNKAHVAEAVTSPFERASLIYKGQPTSEVVLSTPPPHRLVAQDLGHISLQQTAQTKGSDSGSETSTLQLSAQHNPDDVMTIIPADYGPRELVEILELLRQSYNVGLTWRHARLVTRHFNDMSPRRKMTLENVTDYLEFASESRDWYYHVSFEELLRLWPVVLKHHTQDVLIARDGLHSATATALGSFQVAVDNETREELERYTEGILVKEFGSGNPFSIGRVPFEGDFAMYSFLAAFRLNRPTLAGEIAVDRRDCIVAALKAEPAWALAIRKIFPTIDTFFDLGKDVWTGFVNKAHLNFQDNLVRAHVANDLGVPQDKYTRLTPHVAEFIS